MVLNNHRELPQVDKPVSVFIRLIHHFFHCGVCEASIDRLHDLVQFRSTDLPIVVSVEDREDLSEVLVVVVTVVGGKSLSQTIDFQ